MSEREALAVLVDPFAFDADAWADELSVEAERMNRVRYAFEAADRLIDAGHRRPPEPIDERIEAWTAIASHPFFRDCYLTDGTLLDAMLEKLGTEPREVTTVEWAVEYVTHGVADRKGYNQFRDRASCERFIAFPPLWFDHVSMTNTRIVSRVAASEWEPFAPSTEEAP